MFVYITQDKLMEISNELNSRFNKFSGWMKAADGGSAGGAAGGGGRGTPTSSLMDLGGREGERGLRSSPLLVLHGGGGEGETETMMKKKSQVKPSAAATKARSVIRQPAIAPSKSSSLASRHALDDDFLLSGAAAPRSRLSRPTSATSLGQKKVVSRPKGATQQKATSSSALGRASLLAERKRLIRNWNAKD